MISVKVQDHSEVSELFFLPVGDFPVICSKWQHRSHGNASCNILLPVNVKFLVRPKLWLNRWCFWTCPHFQVCKPSLWIIFNLICILISQRKLTNPFFLAQHLYVFFSENPQTVHCNMEAWAVSEILVTNNCYNG